jgi:uncharacterized protein YjbI with pentapeptide repeats
LNGHLQGAKLSFAHLEAASLIGARLEGANLIIAKLQGTHLTRAHLEGADLRGAEGLTLEQIDNTCGDAETKLPEGLCRPTHWTDPKLRPPGLTQVPAA